MYDKFSVSGSNFQHLAWCAMLALTLGGCNSDDPSSSAVQSLSTTSAAIQPFVVNGVPPRTTIEAGSMYRYTPSSSNPDQRILSFTIINKPDWAIFTEANGELSGTPDAGDVGSSGEIEIGVSDGTKHATIGPFRILVTPQPPSGAVAVATPSPPTIAGTPAATVLAGQPYSFAPTVTNPSGADLTFSIVNRPTWATFNPTTGTLSGSPTSANVGSFGNILISVSTGGTPVSLPAFSIQVQPAADSTPTISGTPAATVAAGGNYAFTPVAGDPDGNPLTFSILNGPSWATFSTKTGELSGTAPSSATASLFSNIVISVSDGTLTASLPAFAIQVQATTGGGSGGGHAIRFHPGYYIELDQNANLSQWLATIASLAGAKNVTGVALIQQWNNLEFAEGVYTQGSGASAQGFAAIDQLLAACQSAGLQFILGYDDRSFGPNVSNDSNFANGAFLPSYFDTIESGSPGYIIAPAGTTWTGSLQAIADVTNSAVWAREVALGIAYVSRYNSNSNFEMWRTPETSIAEFTSAGQDDTYFANYAQWMAALRAAAPNTGLSISANFIAAPEPNQFTTLFGNCQSFGVGVGGPDTYSNIAGGTPPSFIGVSNLVFNGYEGGTDWRNVLPWVAENQYGDIPSSEGVDYMSTLYSEMFSGSTETGGSMRPNYWLIQQGQPGPGWSVSTVQAWIGSAGPLNTTRPSAY
jgi:hypothetical protein